MASFNAYIKCDECGEELGGSDSGKSVDLLFEEDFEEEGWIEKKDKHLCPECQ